MWVFAAEQVGGYQVPVIDPLPATLTSIEQAEAFVAATGASIAHGGSRAFYRPSGRVRAPLLGMQQGHNLSDGLEMGLAFCT
jgi:antirestriction protein ArdC